MLSLFPQILFLAPLAITLLRVAAAIYLAYIAWFILNTHTTIERTPLPFIGHAAPWMIWLSAVITAAIAALIFIGAWTQLVAIGATILVTKHLVFYRRLRAILPFSASTYILLAVIFLTLIVSGAGAFAFDLPL